MIIILLSIYTCVEVPFEISGMLAGTMDEEHSTHSHTTFLVMLGWIIDATYFVDIVLNFFTTYISEKTDNEITSISAISVRYLKFYFWIDLIAILPIDLIIKATLGREGSKHLAMQKLIKLFKLLKTLRLRKAV